MHGLFQTERASGCLDDKIGVGSRRSADRLGPQSELTRDRKLSLVPADEQHVRSGGAQRLGTQHSKLPVTQHDDTLILANIQLLEDLEGRGQRLDKNSFEITDLGRNPVEIGDRERQILGKGARAVQDADHSAVRTVALYAAPAPVALPAPDIDLAAHPVPDQARVLALGYLADKFVAQDARESFVPSRDLEVSPADSGCQHADQRFSGGRDRARKGFEPKLAVEDKGPHRAPVSLRRDLDGSGAEPRRRITGRCLRSSQSASSSRGTSSDQSEC